MARYEIDGAHSTIGFTAKHMMFTTFSGQFTDFEGQVEVDGEDYTTARGEFTIRTASVNTNAQQRDDHLRSADFFEAEKYPTMTFRSTGVTRQGDDYKVTGDLTIRDVTRPIDLTVTVEGRVAKDAFGKERVGISARGKINRKDFGLNWNVALETGGWLVSETVNLEIEAAFTAVAPAEVGATAS